MNKVKITTENRTVHNECYVCAHRQIIPGNAHTQCAHPDQYMTGDNHGIQSGWFVYPFNFDPTWKTKMCDNFVEITN